MATDKVTLSVEVKVTGLDEALAKAKLLADTITQARALAEELKTLLAGLSLELDV